MSLRNAYARCSRALRKFFVGPWREDRRRRRRQEDADRVLALARARTPADARVAAAWELILDGLSHQGAPRSNLALMIELLVERRSDGWDEMSFDFYPEEPLDPLDVELKFISDARRCGASALLAELQALAREVDGIPELEDDE